MRPIALIAAGGEGKRLGSIGPKALVRCAGRPLLAWSLDGFAESDSFANGGGLVVVAAHASELDAFVDATAEARARGLEVRVTAGGPSRSHSVAAALRAALDGATGDGATGDGVVLVHDAARIFTGADLIDQLVVALTAAEADLAGLVAARPVTDTIKLVDEARYVDRTPPRERLWAIQTPQAFRCAPLAAALGLTGDVDDRRLATATDDASLVEARGGRVKVFEWARPNAKITTPEDLEAATTRLSRSGA